VRGFGGGAEEARRLTVRLLAALALLVAEEQRKLGMSATEFVSGKVDSAAGTVHRSWWVAEGAVASAERDQRRPMLVLRNGLRVPVSKTFRDQVREAGWLG
jgi:hypothetical protein